MNSDYYKIMNLPRTATTSEIKSRYKVLAKSHHPDRAGNTVTMSQINEAYSVLSKPKLRFEYNQSLAGLKSQEPAKQTQSPSTQPKKSGYDRVRFPSYKRPPSFRPFHSVGYIAIVIIAIALIGLIGLTHQNKHTQLNPTIASSTSQENANSNPQTIVKNSSASTAIPTNVGSKVVADGSSLVTRVQNDFDHGKATIRACKEAQSQISQETSDLGQEIQVTQNLLTKLPSQPGNINSEITRTTQLEEQLSHYRTELTNLQASARIC